MWELSFTGAQRCDGLFKCRVLDGAELFTACLAPNEGNYLRHLLVEFEFTQTSPTQIRIDDRGVIHLSNLASLKKTKHILRAAEF